MFSEIIHWGIFQLQRCSSGSSKGCAEIKGGKHIKVAAEK